MYKHIRIAFISYHPSDAPPSIRDSLGAFSESSSFSIHNYNLAELVRKGSLLRFPDEYSPNLYSAIMLHNTVSYFPTNINTIIESLGISALSNPPAIFLFRQDENNNLQEFRSTLAQTKFDHIFTCLEDRDIPVVYGSNVMQSTTFSRVLTGYIHPRLLDLSHPAYSDRLIDIGYRGSIQPLSFGRLAYEKFSIGHSVAEALSDSELCLDISSSWSDRLGPDQWISFLLNCKATLGAESGASIFDLDGTLDLLVDAAVKNSPFEHSSSAHAEFVLSRIQHLEDNVDYRQISPRHLEAACCKTLQILFPGSYSNILRPFEHYLPLERDLSNLYDIVKFLQSPQQVSQVIDTCYREVALNPEYSLSSFTHIVDSAIERQMHQRDVLKPRFSFSKTLDDCEAPRLHGVNICAHKLHLDPRIAWISECAPSSLSISQVGIDRSIASPIFEEKQGYMKADLALIPFDNNFLNQLRIECRSSESYLAPLLLGQIFSIYSSLKLTPEDFCRHYGLASSSGRYSSFRWYLTYLLDNFRTLYTFLQSVSDISFVIATDLDSLIPALFIKAIRGTPILYDAHEFWPESDPSSSKSEVGFWSYLESVLVPHCNHLQTVSMGLAHYMTQLYSRKFEAVPNAVPIIIKECIKRSSSPRLACRPNSVRFIYQGNFAPFRGLDLLIRHWESLPPEALLYLRGPSGSDYRDHLVELARKNNTLNRSVFFLPSVPEELLVECASSDGDIGLIPYIPAGTNYRYCCPNKLSQYMAAGLPILSNSISFLPDFISSHSIGWSVDFTDAESFRQTVLHILGEHKSLAFIGMKAREVHCASFNWSIVARYFYEAIFNVATPPSTLDHVNVFEVEDPEASPELTSAVRLLNVNRTTLRLQRALPSYIRISIRPIALPILRLIRRFL
jgi:glycosyltransferase involved in cell wall biosynthesis